MSTNTIDLDQLNALFENQKRLDAAFDSIFDDDSFLSELKTLDTAQPSKVKSRSATLKEDRFNDNMADSGSWSILRILIPVALEIVAIIYGISYFS